MAEGNGLDKAAETSEFRLLAPGHTAFMIGGKQVSVPPLTLWCLEAREKEINAPIGKMSVMQYSNNALLVVATSIEAEKAGEEVDPTSEDIEKTFQRLRRRIVFGEMTQLVTMMDSLLLNSGFRASGEAQATETEATVLGTGTLTESSPTSQSEESVEEIPSESSVH